MLQTKDIAGLLGVAIMCATFILLLFKRNSLGEKYAFFITGVGIVTAIEAYATFGRLRYANFSSVSVYTVGISLIVFLIFMTYFYNILHRRNLKIICGILIVLLLLHHAFSWMFIQDFIYKPPLYTHLVNVLLFLCGIILVLKDIFTSEKVLIVQQYFPFWASISLMISYVCVVPLIAAWYSVEDFRPDSFYTILLLVHVLGYSVLLAGIFKSKTAT